MQKAITMKIWSSLLVRELAMITTIHSNRADILLTMTAFAFQCECNYTTLSYLSLFFVTFYHSFRHVCLPCIIYVYQALCSILSIFIYVLHISIRCSLCIACQRCPNYNCILDLTPGFHGLGKDNCKMRRETFEFSDLVWLILEVWLYPWYQHSNAIRVHKILSAILNGNICSRKCWTKWLKATETWQKT